MSLLWQYLRPHRGLVAVALLLAGLAQVLQLVDPLIFGLIVDQYALNPGGRPEAELVRGALGWLAVATAVALLARLCGAGQQYVLQRAVQSTGREMFDDGIRHTLRLSYEEMESRTSGETMALLQKLRTDVERFVTSSVNVLYATLVGVVFLVWYGVTRHWLLIPVFGLGVLLLAVVTGTLSQRIKRLQRQVVRETARMGGAITESLRNVELIKSLGLGRAERQRLGGYTARIFDLEMDKVRRVRTIALVQGTLVNVLRQSILFILLWLIFRTRLSTGELISFQLILNTILRPLRQLGDQILSYREAQASLGAFAGLLATPIEPRPEEPVDVGEIESLSFDEVAFRYRDATEYALEDITFEARLGDTIAFVGPSGSGKSTLVKLLVGLYRPTSGTIAIDGIPTSGLRYNRVRRQIGFVTQDPQLFSGTIRENLLLVKPDATDDEMLDSLHQASADPLLERSGRGLDTTIGESGLRVSGGERQRVSIARALLREPRLLIFDEATSALDSITEQEISAAVRDISSQGGRIVILIAHRLSTIAHADPIYVLERGRIVEHGTHDALVEGRGLYYAMWRQQIGERDVRAAPVPAGPEPADAEDAPDEE
ncbi:MAG: ABC transporter ATP-binding protein/permease [Acidobacteria bacterium]|nr:ABC transporter ATP-binding protein/permease [Acidobacteriota bacterium]